ncbi:hypothetical protein LshimejAT787_1502360 [Lyophyllum shimeji]|uniref:Uncharacterized protein n=1 Tax=Lyophyllum shimeji TaxID=47721 RepID=A0A9P3UTC2_LYOSH|nr:hypothetical protein LshimejAT787_1502360 [Lyophyllum shimeji]
MPRNYNCKASHPCFCGEQDRKPKLPVALNILTIIVSAFDSAATSNKDYLILGAACRATFAGFFCCGEFTVRSQEKFSLALHLTRGSVSFSILADATFCRVELFASKTDLFRKGVSVVLAAGPGVVTCPLVAFKQMFTKQPAPPNAPLFMRRSGKPLTHKFFIEAVCSALLATGFEANKYTGQSFRQGTAASAANASYSEVEIQRLGRWRSDAYKLYIEVFTTRILHISSLLYWVQPSVTIFEPPILQAAAPPLA